MSNKQNADCKNNFVSLEEDSNYLLHIIDHYLKYNPYHDLEKFLAKSTLAAYAFPEHLKELLINFKSSGNTDGFLLLKNLPCEKVLIDTPEQTDSVPFKKKTFYSEFWLSAVGRFLGEPFSYVQENKGNIFHNVRPTPSNQDKLSSESSSILLDFHTETAFHPHMPDYVLLYCLRGDRNHQAQTIVSSIRYFRDDITPELEAILRQPLFKTGIDYSFGSQNGQRGNGPTLPILCGDPQDLLIVFDPDLMMGLNDQAEAAIKDLKVIIDRHKKGVVLEAGDLIIIDNRRALHGRTFFKAYFDGKDRWLQRLYVSRDLNRANMLFAKRERIISYAFDYAQVSAQNEKRIDY